MARNRKSAPAEDVQSVRKSGKRLFRRVFLIVFVGAAVACLRFAPLDANERIIKQAAGLLYRGSVAVMRSRQFGSAARFYGQLGSIRLSMPRTSLASRDNTCAGAGNNQLTRTLFSNPASSSTLRPLSCGVIHIGRMPIAEQPVKSLAIKQNIAVTAAQTTVAVPSAVEPAASPQNVVTSRPRGPVPLVSLRDRATCNQSVVLNVVAHEDDDLLFMNPDIQADISDGRCLRTVYMTSGDAGQDAAYWTGREQGAKAAYAAMYHVENAWRDVPQLLNGKLVQVSYLADVPQIALVFLRLPDGNINGNGFAATANESLYKLLGAQISAIRGLNGVTYSSAELTSALYSLMLTDTPGYVRSFNPDGQAAGDHADHAAVGAFTSRAAAAYTSLHTLAMYAGYPDARLDPNLNETQITNKQAVFLAYAPHDGAVCQTAEACAASATYGNYLARQYKTGEVVSGQ